MNEQEGKAPIYPGPGVPKLKITIPPGRWPGWWDLLARDVLSYYAAEKGAFVWPEAEFQLAETSWVHDNCDPAFPRAWHIDTHHLKNARSGLKGVVMPLSETLNGRAVTAWVLSDSISGRGIKTRVLQLAGAKRRAYRSFLAWAGDYRLCGAVGEQVVADVLDDLRGTRVWLPPGMILGRVTELQGRPLTVGGPLDAAGEWPLDPARLAAGAIPFAVEVKERAVDSVSLRSRRMGPIGEARDVP